MLLLKERLALVYRQLEKKRRKQDTPTIFNVISLS